MKIFSEKDLVQLNLKLSSEKFQNWNPHTELPGVWLSVVVEQVQGVVPKTYRHCPGVWWKRLTVHSTWTVRCTATTIAKHLQLPANKRVQWVSDFVVVL